MTNSSPPEPTGLHRDTSTVAHDQLLASRDEVLRLWLLLSSMDARNYERADEDRLGRFRHSVGSSLRSVVTLTFSLMGSADARASSLSAPAPDDAQIARWSALADICFVAASELSLKCQALEALTPQHPRPRVLSRCDSALRSGRRALRGVDAQLAPLLGIEPSVGTSAELRESLEIRRQYSVLRRTTEGDGTPEGPALVMRLRAIELRITLLTEKDIYPRMRLDDRIELERLHGRLRSALASERDPTEDLRLFQDALGFMQLISQVNLRSELRAQDTALVQLALQALEDSSQATMDESICEAIRPLLGLHDQLDDLLRIGERDRAKYLAALRELSVQLSPDSASAQGI